MTTTTTRTASTSLSNNAPPSPNWTFGERSSNTADAKTGATDANAPDVVTQRVFDNVAALLPDVLLLLTHTLVELRQKRRAHVATPRRPPLSRIAHAVGGELERVGHGLGEYALAYVNGDDQFSPVNGVASIARLGERLENTGHGLIAFASAYDPGGYAARTGYYHSIAQTLADDDDDDLDEASTAPH